MRQGDPLSPFLFVLVMEAFSKMLGAFTSRGLISGFSVGSSKQNRVVVSHLLFANDTLVFVGLMLARSGTLRLYLFALKRSQVSRLI